MPHSRSPSLEPPKKSVELEDPGAHELSSADEDEDVFADAETDIARDTPHRGPRQPGLIIPSKNHETDQQSDSTPNTPGGLPIPMTVVDKVDPDEPSHGDVPNTPAWRKRQSDAVPDMIRRASGSNTPEPQSPALSPAQSPAAVPRMVVTRVDSKPSHGEVPGTAAWEKRKADAEPDQVVKGGDLPISRSSLADLQPAFLEDRPSPIAEDGGFGPMYDDETIEEQTPIETISRPLAGLNILNSDEPADITQGEDSFADDFDDFEEGEEAEGFDDFVEHDEDASEESQPQPPIVEVPLPIDVPDLSNQTSLADLTALINSIKPTVYPLLGEQSNTNQSSSNSSTFLSDRSLSLWSQLVSPPPLQPPNWTKSRIRRLFLVSLGVPVDLDEILPKSKQKKLVLPYSSSDRGRENRKASVSKTQQNGEKMLEVDPKSSARSRSQKRRRGPAAPPNFDLSLARRLYDTTEAALDGMSVQELNSFVRSLETLVGEGRTVLQYWITRKDQAVGEKEAFDGVIENLVQHARRVRR